MKYSQRHVNQKLRPELIRQQLQKTPEKLERQAAESPNVSPITVGTQRKALEESGDVSELDTSTDTIEREQTRKRNYKYIGESPEGERAITTVAEEIRAEKTAKKKQARTNRRSRPRQDSSFYRCQFFGNVPVSIPCSNASMVNSGIGRLKLGLKSGLPTSSYNPWRMLQVSCSVVQALGSFVLGSGNIPHPRFQSRNPCSDCHRLASSC